MPRQATLAWYLVQIQMTASRGRDGVIGRFVGVLERQSRSVTIASQGRRAGSAVRYVGVRWRPVGNGRA
jgi:hypothetical protein